MMVSVSAISQDRVALSHSLTNSGLSLLTARGFDSNLELCCDSLLGYGILEGIPVSGCPVHPVHGDDVLLLVGG